MPPTKKIKHAPECTLHQVKQESFTSTLYVCVNCGEVSIVGPDGRLYRLQLPLPIYERIISQDQ